MAKGPVSDSTKPQASEREPLFVDGKEIPLADLDAFDDFDESDEYGDPIWPPDEVSLADVHQIARTWFGDKYDLDVLDAVCAAAASEQLDGDPLWLLVVSGPGAAKTETVQSLTGVKGAHMISTISSDGALLSATRAPKRTKGKSSDATGGLLRKIGARGILIIKDVTSLVNAPRETRNGVLAALREIHDGRWVRNVGIDGGKTMEWSGRIVVVGAVTTAWDAAHSVVSAMGDRFVLIRIDSNVGRKQSGLQAIRSTGDETEKRAVLAAAVSNLLTHACTDEVTLSEEEEEQLVKAADIVTKARTAVERDYSGEIIDAHAPEMPTRFAKQLVLMMRGAIAIGMQREQAMRLAIRCARDSIPPLRLEILLDVVAHPLSRPGDVRQRLSKPWRTVKREMEALNMLGILRCEEKTADVDVDGVPTEKTKWFYEVHSDFDSETLNAMAANDR